MPGEVSRSYTGPGRKLAPLDFPEFVPPPPPNCADRTPLRKMLDSGVLSCPRCNGFGGTLTLKRDGCGELYSCPCGHRVVYEAAPADALAQKIAAEPEWQPSTAALRDAILRRFTERLDAVAAAHPDRLNQALAVIVQAGPGRTVLVISDPAAADLVTELQRHVEAGEPSPLTALLQSRVPL